MLRAVDSGTEPLHKEGLIMKLVIGILFALVSFGSVANAVPTEAEIQAYMSHLNTHFNNPALNVKAKNNLKNAAVRKATDKDLQLLEDVLQGELQLDDAALKQLSCGRPVCDGGDLRRREQVQ